MMVPSQMLVFCTVCTLQTSTWADEDDRGTDFVLGFLQNKESWDSNSTSPEDGLELIITTMSTTPISVTITHPLFNSSWVRTVAVSKGEAQTVQLQSALYGHEIEKSNKGVKMKASGKASVMAVSRQRQSTDAFTVLPIDVLGTEYYVLTYIGAAELLLVGVQNNTQVTVQWPTQTASVRVLYEGTTYRNGDTLTLTLDALETFHALQLGNDSDFTGTHVTSDKPIAVLSGNRKTGVPVGAESADHLSEMLMPVGSWGKRFITSSTPDRDDGDVFRIVASQAGTVVKQNNGSSYAIVSSGGFIDLDLPTGRYQTITSDKPVQVAMFSKSCRSNSSKCGDPAMSIVPPVDQFTSEFSWSSFASSSGEQFSNNLVIVTEENEASGLRLDGANVTWHEKTDIPGSSGMVHLWSRLTPGPHNLHHTDPSVTYMALVSGTARYEAYAFTASSGQRDINSTSASRDNDGNCDEGIGMCDGNKTASSLSNGNNTMAGTAEDNQTINENTKEENTVAKSTQINSNHEVNTHEDTLYSEGTMVTANISATKDSRTNKSPTENIAVNYTENADLSVSTRSLSDFAGQTTGNKVFPGTIRANTIPVNVSPSKDISDTVNTVAVLDKVNTGFPDNVMISPITSRNDAGNIKTLTIPPDYVSINSTFLGNGTESSAPQENVSSPKYVTENVSRPENGTALENITFPENITENVVRPKNINGNDTSPQNNIPVENITNNYIPLENVTEKVIGSENVTENVILPKRIAENDIPLENITRNNAPLENVTENALHSENVTENVILPKNIAENDTSPENVTENDRPLENVTKTRTPLENVTEKVIRSENVTENVMLPKSIAENYTSPENGTLLENITRNNSPLENVTENVILSENVTENIILPEGIAEGNTSQENVTNIDTSLENTTKNVTPLEKENILRSENVTENVIPPKNITENDTSLENITPLESATENVLHAENVTDNGKSSENKTINATSFENNMTNTIAARKDADKLPSSVNENATDNTLVGNNRRDTSQNTSLSEETAVKVNKGLLENGTGFSSASEQITVSLSFSANATLGNTAPDERIAENDTIPSGNLTIEYSTTMAIYNLQNATGRSDDFKAVNTSFESDTLLRTPGSGVKTMMETVFPATNAVNAAFAGNITSSSKSIWNMKVPRQTTVYATVPKTAPVRRPKSTESRRAFLEGLVGSMERSTWSGWSPWGNCTGACDAQTQVRQRSCIYNSRLRPATHCIGEVSQTRTCSGPDCQEPQAAASTSGSEQSTSVAVGIAGGVAAAVVAAGLIYLVYLYVQKNSRRRAHDVSSRRDHM